MSRPSALPERGLPPPVVFLLMRIIVARDNCESYRKRLPEHGSETKRQKSDESASRKGLAKMSPKEVAAIRSMLRSAEDYLAQMLSAFRNQFPQHLDALNDIVRDET
jgi:hypothetical protein